LKGGEDAIGGKSRRRCCWVVEEEMFLEGEGVGLSTRISLPGNTGDNLHK